MEPSEVSIVQKMNALTQDLLHPGGPAISAMQNYPFALFQYLPRQEFEMRLHLRRTLDKLRSKGWIVEHVNLFETLIEAVKELEGEDVIEGLIADEKSAYSAGADPMRALAILQSSLGPFINSKDGLPEAINQRIREIKSERQGRSCVIFVTRAGTLYPFHRTSGLLRYLEGEPSVPVILMYPGTRPGDTSLSFMAELSPDADYRPRIY